MVSILMLVFVPLIAAISVLVIRNNNFRNSVARFFVFVISILSIFVVYKYFNGGLSLSFEGIEIIDYTMMAIEALVAVYIVTVSIKNKKYLVSAFAIIQTSLLIWFELTQKSGIEVHSDIIFDKLSAIMILIIGIIGSLICLYAVGYMQWYHIHHSEYKDRKPFFFFVLFLFLAAMFGLVLSNNLTWLYFFWELTTLCSFLLIGYTKTKDAVANSFRALVFNLGGGLAFALAIVLLGINYETLELSALTKISPEFTLLVPVLLLSIAALTKSAQLPFSSWLLGAMVAPTPTSALLHSATMVKAGVYLIIRLSPLLGNNAIGKMVTLVGAITFLATSLIAIAQSDAKKILAYSTIANLGLIITCASIGTQEALWGAILLVIFHAISKSLLFLSVGSVEHQLGSKNVEDMDVLLDVSKKLTFYMIIGIAGMFLAPFGMLISKWVAIEAFIVSNNIHIVILVVFGSSATLFYWTKWMGKLISNANSKNNEKHKFHLDEEVPIFTQAVLTGIACFTFPVISKLAIIPFLTELFGVASISPISSSDMYIMFIMMSTLLVVPISFLPIYKTDDRRIVPIYMAGENTGNNETFNGSIGVQRKVKLRNWYMTNYFGNGKLLLWSNILSVAVICAGAIILVIGGMS